MLIDRDDDDDDDDAVVLVDRAVGGDTEKDVTLVDDKTRRDKTKKYVEGIVVVKRTISGLQKINNGCKVVGEDSENPSSLFFGGFVL